MLQAIIENILAVLLIMLLLVSLPSGGLAWFFTRKKPLVLQEKVDETE